MSSHLEEAKKLKNEFKIREALTAFEKAYEEDNNNIEAVANTALCHMMIGNLEKAKSFFEKSAELNPEDLLVKLYISIINVALGQEYEITPINNVDVNVSEQFMSSAEMFYMIRLRDESFKLFEVIVSEIKDDNWLNLASNQYRIVAMLARFGFFMEAKDIADKLVAENDKSWHGYASLAQIELEQGNITEAKSWFKKAIQNGGDKDSLVVAAIADTRLLEITDKATKH